MLRIAACGGSNWTTACHRLTLVGAHFNAPCSPRREALLVRTHCSAAMPSAASKQSSARPLDRLERVLNARDLAEACPAVVPGRVFRSGNPAGASLPDVLLLRRDLRISHMIDLRSSEEQREDKGWPLVLSNGVMRSYDGQGRLQEVAVDGVTELDGMALPPCALQRLSLLEKNRFIWGLMWRLPPLKVAQALAYRVAGWHDAMRDVLVPEINRGGLSWVYEILLDSAGADIARALELMLDAAEQRRPQLVFCKLGKDRTGVMSALILTCCGASEDEIVADYARSDGVDSVALGGLEKMRDMQGMDARLFASAPPEAMRSLLAYAERRWGGLAGYMGSIGFDEEQQAALGQALTEDEAWE